MADQDKPAPVSFNFDDWERETEVEPFVVVIDGKRHEAIDPLELDYRKFADLMDDEDVEAQFRLLFPDGHEQIMKTKHIKAGALREFAEKVAKHYGLGPTSASGR